MAKIIRTEIRKRGIFGKLFKWLFILFNILMVFWLLSYFVQIGELANNAGSDAERAGVGLGGAMGIGMILGTWAFGDVILGLFTILTRGKKTIIEETVG